jgi:hypothetical protein
MYACMAEQIVDIRAFQCIHELILNSNITSDTALMAAKIQATHRLVQEPRHELGLSAHHDQRILQQASLIFHYRRRCHNGRRKDCVEGRRDILKWSSRRMDETFRMQFVWYGATVKILRSREVASPKQ